MEIENKIQIYEPTQIIWGNSYESIGDEKQPTQEELWKQIYNKDRRMLGHISQLDFNEEEREIVLQLEQQPFDYIPFSDTSDTWEVGSDFNENDKEVKNEEMKEILEDIREIETSGSFLVGENKEEFDEVAGIPNTQIIKTKAVR